MTIRIMLVDDHAIVRSGLHMILEPRAELSIIAEADTGAQAIKTALEQQPDVILMDIGLPDMTGIEAARAIKADCESCAIIALTIHDDEEYFFKMLEAGASGYLPKRAAPDELLVAIETVVSGDVYLYPSLARLLVKDFLEQSEPDVREKMDGLTPREQEVLTHIAEGATNQEIGQLLSISPKTVSRHRENIMNKLDIHSRVELTRYAIRKRIIQP